MHLFSEHADDICFLVTTEESPTVAKPSLAGEDNAPGAGDSEASELIELGSTLRMRGIAVNKQRFKSGLVQQTGHLRKKRANSKSVMMHTATNKNALPSPPGHVLLTKWLEAEACNSMPLVHQSVCNLSSSLVYGNGSRLHLRAAKSANAAAQQGGNVQVVCAVSASVD